MNNNQWMNDPLLANVDKNKLMFLGNLISQGSSLSQKEMLPFLLSFVKQSKNSNISFTKDEIQLIISVAKKYATPEELEKLEKLSPFFHFQ